MLCRKKKKTIKKKHTAHLHIYTFCFSSGARWWSGPLVVLVEGVPLQLRTVGGRSAVRVDHRVEELFVTRTRAPGVHAQAGISGIRPHIDRTRLAG